MRQTQLLLSVEEFRISEQNDEVAVDVVTDVIPEIELPDSYDLELNPALNLNQKDKKNFGLLTNPRHLPPSFHP